MDERVDPIVGEGGPSIQKVKLNYDPEPAHDASQPLYKRCGRFGSATGGQEVIHDIGFHAGLDRVDVHFNRVRPILQRVFFGDSVVGQFAELPDEHEGKSQFEGNGHSEDESPTLDADDRFRPCRFRAFGHQVNDFLKRGGVFKHRCDVLKQDAWLREIWNISDNGGGNQVGHLSDDTERSYGYREFLGHGTLEQ